MTKPQKLSNSTLAYLKLRYFIEKLIIVILSPFLLVLMFFVYLIVRIKLHGGAYFIQERTGLHCKMFKIYKFKTMRDHDSSEINHKEELTTPTTRFLRKHRLDELPQLLNILKGEMSLIGPRPEPVFYYNKMIEAFPQYILRYNIKPGITGWAQVKYKHTDDIEGGINKFYYDMEYIENLSLKYDILIFIKTFSVIFNGKGAK